MGTRRLLVVGVLALVTLGRLGAKDRVHGDQEAIERVIRAQMAAFQRDDAAAAFALSSPGIQQLFHSPAEFMAAVRDSYRPVYRPGDVVFLPLSRAHGKTVAPVQIGMPDGKVWMARFDMIKGPGGTWKINGCTLSLTDSIST